MRGLALEIKTFFRPCEMASLADLPPVSLIPVMPLDLQISLRIFKKLKNLKQKSDHTVPLIV